MTLIYIIGILSFALTLDENTQDKEAVFRLILPVVLLTGIFLWIAYKTGEKPHWHWGPPDDKDLI